MKCEICNKEIDDGVAFTFGAKSFYISDSNTINIVDKRLHTHTYQLNGEFPRICYGCWPIIHLLMKILNIERTCEAVGMYLGDNSYGHYNSKKVLMPTKLIRKKKG